MHVLALKLLLALHYHLMLLVLVKMVIRMLLLLLLLLHNRYTRYRRRITCGWVAGIHDGRQYSIPRHDQLLGDEAQLLLLLYNHVLQVFVLPLQLILNLGLSGS